MTEPVQPPPAIDTQWRPAGPSGPRAGFWRRFLALLIDSIIVGIAGGVLVGIGGALDSNALIGIGYAVWLIGFAVYEIYFHGGPSGQTVGKRALGIRVIDFASGGPIGYGRATIRWLGRIISGLFCYLGYLWMLWDQEKQTWHDKMANDVVVPTQYYPVEHWP
ncbi:MAG TPA: RDD family protein [Gaiellaceae bacterium]|jgi:uncharacterized RDD family membrane protein YckC|nr:RDD family protein [Gaiellaceae bacterium]